MVGASDARTTFITGVRWVPRGVAREEPIALLTNPVEIAKMAAEMKDVQAQLKKVSLREDADVSSENELSDDDEDSHRDDITLEKTEKKMAKGFRGSQFFSVIERELPTALGKDPLLKGIGDADDSDVEDEADALRIRPSDCPLVACSTDRESTTLEVYTYDYETSGFYVHHDVQLAGPPLCVEWLRYGLIRRDSGYECVEGNIAALGYYDNCVIELWDLDVVDCMEPIAKLGHKKSKKKQSPAHAIEGHSDAVMTLAANPFNGQILASGSADCTVRIWDLTVPQTLATLTHHRDKVQTVAWNPKDDQVIGTAGYDRIAAVCDLRSLNDRAVAALSSDAEAMSWNRHNEFELWVSEESGLITVWDLRQLPTISVSGKGGGKKLKNIAATAQPLHRLGRAHNVHNSRTPNPTTCITDSDIPGLMISANMEGVVTVWDARGSEPQEVFQKDLKAGSIHSCHVNPDEKTVFAFAASSVVIWDVGESNVINKRFDLPLNVE